MTVSASLPRARLSADALRENARVMLARGGVVFDLRADAYGHGASEAAQILHAEGVQRVLVDPDAREPEVPRGLSVTSEGESDADAALLYGLPGGGGRPVMRLSGRVLSLKPLRAGEGVSYGYSHRAAADTTVALVAGGYAHGIVRALGNRATVELGGRRHPIIGRVAMDACVIDLEEAHPSISLGDEAVFFGGTGVGRDLLAEWATVTGLTTTELVTVAGDKAVRTWER